MDTHGQELPLILHNGGIVFFENEKSLNSTADALHEAGLTEGQSRPISPEAVHRAAVLFQGGSQLHLESGRYLKLTQESYDFLQKHGVRNPISGTIRRGDIGELRNSSQFVKNLAFEAGSRTPAVLSNAAGIVAQAAIEHSLTEIKGYLRDHTEKLDQLLRQPRDQSLNRLKAFEIELRTHENNFATNQRISHAGWDRIAGLGVISKEIAFQALGQLDSVTKELSEAKGDVRQLEKSMPRFNEEIQYWLVILAHSLQQLSRFDRLSVARTVDLEPDSAVSFATELLSARETLETQICLQLRDLQTVIHDSLSFSDAAWARQNQRIAEIVGRANIANTQIGEILIMLGEVDMNPNTLDPVSRRQALMSLGAKGAKGALDYFESPAGQQAAGKAIFSATRFLFGRK